MSNLKRHVKGGKVKWVITVIAFLVVAVILVGIALQVFMPEGQRPSNWVNNVQDGQPNEQDEQPAEANRGEAVIGDITERGVSLKAVKLSATDYASNGVSPLALSAYTLTATVLPENATNKAVTWSMAWDNAQSEWASGKDISDYILLSGTDSLTVTVTCLEPFGEPLTITCTSQDNAEAQATCSVNFRQAVSSFGLKFTAEGQEYDITTSPTLPISGEYTSEATYEKTAGTIESEFATSVQISFTDSFKLAMEESWGISWGKGYNYVYTVEQGTAIKLQDVLINCATTVDEQGTYINNPNYAPAVYNQIMSFIADYDGAIFAIRFTITNTVTEEQSVYVYECGISGSMVYHVESVGLNESEIVF